MSLSPSVDRPRLVRLHATDNVGVVDVRLYVDGTQVSSDSTSSFAIRRSTCR